MQKPQSEARLRFSAPYGTTLRTGLIPAAGRLRDVAARSKLAAMRAGRAQPTMCLELLIARSSSVLPPERPRPLNHARALE